MFISIIIPTCNRNDLLSKCLDSLALQYQTKTFDFEVVVSDDSLVNAAKSLIEDHYSFAKWTEGPRRGPAANRNNGAKQAQGKWLVFFDDDCIPDHDIIANYDSYILENSGVDVIEGAIYSDPSPGPLFTAPVNLDGGHLWSCNFAINKQVFDTLGGFDENYKFPNLEDNDLNKRLIIGGYKIFFNKNAKVYHPQRPVAVPKTYAKYHESWMYYHAKFGDNKSLMDLLSTITRTRLRGVLHNPKNLSSVKALWLLVIELYYTLQYSSKWKPYKNEV